MAHLSRLSVLGLMAFALSTPVALYAQSPGGFHHDFGHMGPPPGLGGMMPPDRWWDDPHMAQTLKIAPAQQTKMDSIFESSRLSLIDAFASVEKAEVTLEPLMEAEQPNEAAILAQIDHVAEARATLEKARARMLLSLRAQLTHDQWDQLKTLRFAHRGPGEGFHHQPMGQSFGPPHDGDEAPAPPGPGR